MSRFVCIHGHFYQPPRENPWLEAVGEQDSAYPYHDWNERVTDESYAPNSAARILDGDGRIVRIIDNYERISFDFGPTLLGWLQGRRPELYEHILAADRKSAERFAGHGSAMAQAFHHTILPLANARDKRTEILWGLRDFRHRFRRDPEGMWLPECAVDLETLDLLAGEGVAFTVLSPRQARRVREIGSDDWLDVDAGSLDTTRAYLVRLPSGSTIAVFFFDDAIAREISFGGLLRDGDRFAERLAGAFADDADRAQLVHVATDGETFGHHHDYGDMALARALQRLGSSDGIRLTNYAEFLDLGEPSDEVELIESTSWSCAHGIERWCADCGCVTGREDWKQDWRGPLREALDFVRDELAERYATRAAELFDDPWRARDEYVDVVLDRSSASVERFFRRQGAGGLSQDDRVIALRLLEMQRRVLQSYTSCGWFFDDISRIETVQTLSYAARALQLAGELFEHDFETEFVRLLERAPSNLQAFGDGAGVFERLVAPARVDLPRVAAHYAVGHLFGLYQRNDDVYVYRVEGLEEHRQDHEHRKLCIGRARVTSRISGNSRTSTYAVIHFGDQDLGGWLGDAGVELELLRRAAEEHFASDVANLVRTLDQTFGERRFSLRSLFRDEQRKIALGLLEPLVQKAEASYRELFDADHPRVGFLEELRQPLPPAIKTAAQHLLNVDLRRQLGNRPLDLDHMRRLLDLARTFDVRLDSPGLCLQLQRTLADLARRLASDGDGLETLDELDATAALLDALPFEADLWEPQNILYRLYRSQGDEREKRAGHPDEGTAQAASAWLDRFRSVAAKLSVKIE